MASGGCCSGGEDTGEVIFLVCYSREKGKMKIVSVSGCSYEDYEGGVLNLNVELEAGEMLCEGGNISIEMMDGSFLERAIEIINPKRAGDYAVVSNKAKQWKRSGGTLKEAKGPGCYVVVVKDVAYHEVKTDEEMARRTFLEEHYKKVCVSPFREILCGDKSIYDSVQEGYVVLEKVIAYLKTTKPYLMSPGIYEHPFKKGENLAGPYTYTDGHYWWDRDTWKYVVKYHVTLPQEFIDHVMSEAGTEFLESCAGEDECWSKTIRVWKETKRYDACLLSDDTWKKELENF